MYQESTADPQMYGWVLFRQARKGRLSDRDSYDGGEEGAETLRLLYSFVIIQF